MRLGSFEKGRMSESAPYPAVKYECVERGWSLCENPCRYPGMIPVGLLSPYNAFYSKSSVPYRYDLPACGLSCHSRRNISLLSALGLLPELELSFAERPQDFRPEVLPEKLVFRASVCF